MILLDCCLIKRWPEIIDLLSCVHLFLFRALWRWTCDFFRPNFFFTSGVSHLKSSVILLLLAIWLRLWMHPHIQLRASMNDFIQLSSTCSLPCTVNHITCQHAVDCHLIWVAKSVANKVLEHIICDSWCRTFCNSAAVPHTVGRDEVSTAVRPLKAVECGLFIHSFSCQTVAALVKISRSSRNAG